MKRHKPEGLSVAKNIEDVLTAIDHHSWFADVEKPNQTHDHFVTYDIGCNEDLALHYKFYEFQKIVKFFKEHDKAYGSFATKYVNPKMLSFNPGYKMRIRFSLMPETIRQILEPNTSTIAERLHAVRLFQDAGYDVHLNFSPVVVYDNWLEDYKELFLDIHDMSVRQGWHEGCCVYPDRPVKAEVIFLTHNKDKHEYNLKHGILGEELLWRPDIQEDKVSEYGGENIRYKSGLKEDYIRSFRSLHDLIIPWNTIRYIF
jgi:spore photoproduct lyase